MECKVGTPLLAASLQGRPLEHLQHKDDLLARMLSWYLYITNRKRFASLNKNRDQNSSFASEPIYYSTLKKLQKLSSLSIV